MKNFIDTIGCLGIVIIVLMGFGLLDSQQEAQDAADYKQDTIKQAKSMQDKHRQEMRALAIEAEYMTGFKVVQK